MKHIQINQTTQAISETETLASVLDRLEIQTRGIAIASGEQIIPKKRWQEYIPVDGEVLTIIRATCGG
ncbi:MAG: sulfur carrier protein ThiS [Bacteroidales bacterium]